MIYNPVVATLELVVEDTLHSLFFIPQEKVKRQSGFENSMDPDPVLKFLGIRIRFQPPDAGAKKEYRKGSKSYY